MLLAYAKGMGTGAGLIMAIGGTLMTGWTLLLVWALQDPIGRRAVILLTAYASQETAIEAVNKGAFHYLIKQARNDEIKMVVRNALEVKQVKSENHTLKRALTGKREAGARPPSPDVARNRRL